MVSVRLRNPDIILTPIIDNEKKQFGSNFIEDESIYVLYRLPNSEGIHIGMVSPSMRKYFSSTANVWNLENATAMAFFYNGGSELKNIAFQVTDRPVYRVRTSDDRMVLGYDVLNGTPENGLIIPIEDIIDGNYTLNIETPPLLR